MPETARSRFGEELHAIREDKRQKARLSESARYSLRGLAERAGISASAIGQLEIGKDPRTGKDIRPRLDTIHMLAAALADDEEEERAIRLRLMAAAGYVVQAENGLLVQFPDYPSVEVLTRGIRNNPDIPERVQRAVIEMLELTEEINRKALEDEDQEP